MSYKTLEPVLSESFLEQMLKDHLFLPMLWQIIYEEQFCENHLIFNEKDISFLNSLSQKELSQALLNKQEFLINFAEELTKQISLKQIKFKIEQLCKEEKIAFFCYYKRLMQHWNHIRKKSLH